MQLNGLLKYVTMQGNVNMLPGKLLVLLVGDPDDPGSEAASLIGWLTRRLQEVCGSLSCRFSAVKITYMHACMPVHLHACKLARQCPLSRQQAC